MNVVLTDTAVRVELTAYEKIGGLRGNLEIPYEHIVAATVDHEPFRSIRGRLKVGLRIPGRLFVCSTGRGRELWAIRRGAPALALTLVEGRRPRRVTVSAADAEALAAAIAGRRRAGAPPAQPAVAVAGAGPA